MKNLFRIAVSMAVSALLVGLLFGLLSSTGGAVSPADIFRGLKQAIPAFVAVYVLAQIIQAVVRAQRSRVLLRASCGAAADIPGLFHMTLVTFVRGACADMLPARLGELSYVAMLNRGYSVPAADCFSSLSISLLFDFIALLAVLAVAIPGAAQGLSLVGSLIMLAMICVAGLFILFVFLPWFARRIAPLGQKPFFRLRPVAALLKLVRDVSDAVVAVRRAGVAVPVVSLSVLIRAAKYGGLYFLFVAVTRPVWPELSEAGGFAVLVALIAAEGAASLPVPTFMSFGSYEAGGLAALTALGFGAADSMAAMMTMHVLSQIIDYSAGGLAFLLFTWLSGKKRNAAPDAAKPIRPGNRFARVCTVLGVLAVLGAALLFAAFQFRAIRKRGRLVAPPVGEAVVPTEDEAAARASALEAFGGKIVWSSNRAGSHDIWFAEGPKWKPRRLTQSGFTDTYPRFSPDGRLVSFSRSTEPWVSQRNFEKWDTWIVDVATGRERRVATNAYQACWCNTNKLIFVRAGGTRLVCASTDGDTEDILLESGVPPLDEGVLVTLPDERLFGDPSIALTLRGGKKATVHVRPADGIKVHVSEVKEIAGGCQMVWRNVKPFDWSFAWIDHPGRMKNAIYTFDGQAKAPVILLDAEEPWSHEYFPRFAEGGRWLVYGASTGGHEQDSEDYEIFLWDSANTNIPPARLTFHTGNDCWPDICL